MDKTSKLCGEDQCASNFTKKYTAVENLKIKLHRANWSYLCRHPELRAIIRVFLHELIDKQPEDIFEFSAALFNCNNSPLLVSKINQQLKWINKTLKQNCWSHHDGEMFFSETGSTHSLLSKTSLANDMTNMLRYAMIMKDQK